MRSFIRSVISTLLYGVKVAATALAATLVGKGLVEFGMPTVLGVGAGMTVFIALVADDIVMHIETIVYSLTREHKEAR